MFLKTCQRMKNYEIVNFIKVNNPFISFNLIISKQKAYVFYFFCISSTCLFVFVIFILMKFSVVISYFIYRDFPFFIQNSSAFNNPLVFCNPKVEIYVMQALEIAYLTESETTLLQTHKSSKVFADPIPQISLTKNKYLINSNWSPQIQIKV